MGTVGTGHALHDAMNRALTVAEIATLLPDLEELRPVMEHVLTRSVPDPSRAWAGSGVLGAAGDRLVRFDDAIAEVHNAFEEAEAHRRDVFDAVARAIERQTTGDAEGCASAFLEAAAAEESRQNMSRADAYADAAWRTLEGAPDSSTRRRALRRRARARRAMGDLRAAVEDYRRSFEMAEASADVEGMAEAAIGAGNCCEDRASWDEALVWYRRALGTIDEADHSGPEHWQALLNEHIVQRSQGDLEASMETLDRADRAAVGFDGADFFLRNARGQLRLALGDPAGAEDWLRAALAQAPGGRARVTIRVNLAEALLAAGRLLEAAEEVRTAEYEAIVGRVHAQLPEVYRLLGRISAARGEGDAFVLFEKSLTLIAEQGLPAIEKSRTLLAYADSESKLGNEERAAEMRAEAESIRDQLGFGARDTSSGRHQAIAEHENGQEDG